MLASAVWIFISLPKRDELRLRTVTAQPKASSTGFAAISASASAPLSRREWCARYVTSARHDSVLPAPDSPDTTIDWSRASEMSMRRARSAIAYTCGGSTPSARPLYRSIASSVYSAGSRLYGLSASSTVPVYV